MRRLVVTNSVTLDGVMQAPGRPDEDPRGGFKHGGWAIPYADAKMGEVMGRGAGESDAILLGRRTYEDFERVWSHQTEKDSPYAPILNNTQKYVASRTLKEPLSW